MPIPSRYVQDAGAESGDDSKGLPLTANSFSNFREQFLAGFHRESEFLPLEHVYYYIRMILSREGRVVRDNHSGTVKDTCEVIFLAQTLSPNLSLQLSDIFQKISIHW
jgi:hypothetical protein